MTKSRRGRRSGRRANLNITRLVRFTFVPASHAHARTALVIQSVTLFTHLFVACARDGSHPYMHATCGLFVGVGVSKSVCQILNVYDDDVVMSDVYLCAALRV